MMDVSLVVSSCHMSVSEDLSSSCEFSSVPPESSSNDIGDCYVNDLGDCVTKLLNIRSEEKLTCVIVPSLDDSNNGNTFKEGDFKDSSDIELAKFTSDKHLAKCATFPCAGKGKSAVSAEISDGQARSKDNLTAENETQSGDGEFSNIPYSRSISLPDRAFICLPVLDHFSFPVMDLPMETPLKLISAMKGSREKLGAPPRKLTVKWAPDVYDPLPTAESHLPINRPQRHKNDKRNGKNKQRGGGKASRGNKGKDKKQSRKCAGSSNRGFKSLDKEDKVTCSSEPQATIVDFDAGNTDPFCGHSFLKKSVTQLHFPVAEAT